MKVEAAAHRVTPPPLTSQKAPAPGRGVSNPAGNGTITPVGRFFSESETKGSAPLLT